MMACNKFLLRSPCIFNGKSSCNFLKLSKTDFKHGLNKLSLGKAYNYINCSHYSTVFCLQEKYHKRCNTKSHKYGKILDHRIFSASYLSTLENKDAFQIVVTDPSTSTTKFSDDLSSISEVAKNLSEFGSNGVTNASETAVLISNELQNIAEVVEPSLSSLGLANYTPVGLIQVLLEYCHINMHMPWWMAIAFCTVIARVLLLPILIKTQKNTVKMSNHMPQLQFLQSKFGEARRSGNTMEASRYASEIVHFMKEHDISPIKNAMLPLAQAPVFLSFFLGLRAMAKAPVESMKEGGIWWATDLTIPDPYYIMPVIACSTLYIVIKVGAESGVKLENMKMSRYILQALPVVALPFCINFPAAVLFYWCTTNFCTLAFVSILKLPPVRQFLKMPTQKPIDPKFVAPKKSFISGIKDAYQDQKALATVEDRRRVDEIRFQKAGTGPIPRTYSYDPTKVKPSNVAAAARQSLQTISAKEHKT